MKQSDANKALVWLMRKKSGNWTETEELIGTELITELKDKGYIRKEADCYKITTAGKQEALRIVFNAECF